MSSKLIVLLFLLLAQSLFASEEDSSSSKWVYLGKEIVEKEGYPPIELEVWLGTTKVGDEIRRVFRKWDRKFIFWYDSTAYQNGDWRVFEIDNTSMETKEITSWGTKVLFRYDDKKRLLESYYINEKADTLVSEQYVWENGRLAKAIISGKSINFIYGTPCDTIRVEPTDDGVRGNIDFNPPPTYDKSFGLIPDESDLGYEGFKRNPYRYYASPEVLERQKARCEEYKKGQRKKGDSK